MHSRFYSVWTLHHFRQRSHQSIYYWTLYLMNWASHRRVSPQTWSDPDCKHWHQYAHYKRYKHPVIILNEIQISRIFPCWSRDLISDQLKGALRCILSGKSTLRLKDIVPVASRNLNHITHFSVFRFRKTWTPNIISWIVIEDIWKP
jgi:hypothetical protein